MFVPLINCGTCGEEIELDLFKPCPTCGEYIKVTLSGEPDVEPLVN